MPRTRHCVKRSTPSKPMTTETDTLTEALTDETIEPPIDSQTPDIAPVIPDEAISDELFNPTQSVLQSAKAIQEASLAELRSEMDALTKAFADRAVAIVQEGMKNCFFVASQRIRQINLPDWIMSNGETLEGVVMTLPGDTTDGDTE